MIHPEAGGIVYARSFTVSWMPDKADTAVVESVEVNLPLDEARFAIPAEIR